MFTLEIGNPQSGLKLHVDLGPETDKYGIHGVVTHGCEVLREAAEAWKAWSLANETPDEKKQRLLSEQLGEIQMEQAQAQVKAHAAAKKMVAEA